MDNYRRFVLSARFFGAAVATIKRHFTRMGPSEDTSICERTEACKVLFARCLSTPVFTHLGWFENRQGEFILWAAGLKAASHGRSSLDHHVRDHSEVRDLIYHLLGGLLETLEDLVQIGMADHILKSWS